MVSPGRALGLEAKSQFLQHGVLRCCICEENVSHDAVRRCGVVRDGLDDARGVHMAVNKAGPRTRVP